MGLDYVELILSVEAAFGVWISDEEAGTVSTVGELHQLIVSKMEGERTDRCLTSMAFYRTRSSITSALGVDRRKVKPSTALEDLFPVWGRRERWRRTQRAARVRIPDLQHPGWVTLSMLGLGIAALTAAGLHYNIRLGWLPFMFLAGLACGGMFIRISPALALAFPQNATTVGELAQDVLAANYTALVKEASGWKERDVWNALCRVIAAETGVDPKKIQPAARVVADLGID